MKKDSGLFGVGMGAFDGTEVWELLHKLSENYEKINHAIFNNVRGTVSKKKKEKKKEKNIFVSCWQDMSLITECNRKVLIAQTTLGLWKNHNTGFTWKTAIQNSITPHP